MSRPTIALDATYSIGRELSGVGLYSREILYGLAAAHPEVRFHFCYRPHRYLRSWRENLPVNARRRLLAEPVGPRSTLFHGLNQRLPQIPLRAAVSTFHDLFVLSGEYSTPEFRARFAQQAREAAARSAAIITVSAFTKSQVVSLLGVAPEKVHVVHHGFRRLEFPGEVVREKIVLNVGAIQKRKNILRLVEAFETLDPAWRLVLAGASGFGSQDILARIETSPARERISVLGYVTNADLAAWYGRARIFAFPSLDEGFGMPVIEAMAAGTPVIASNSSALPEVAGDAALLVDPENTSSLADALRRLAGDCGLWSEMAERGAARAREFTWEKAIRETWNVYQQVVRF